MGQIIAILEDDKRRVQAMKDELRLQAPSASLVFFDNAPDMIAWLKDNLASVRLLSLDHDLGPNRTRGGTTFDPGIGRDVADFLAGRPASCPVLIHSTNVDGARGMQFVLEAAGWQVDRVSPFEDLLWVKAQWSGRVATLVRSGHKP
jgi:hypothetical protein